MSEAGGSSLSPCSLRSLTRPILCGHCPRIFCQFFFVAYSSDETVAKTTATAVRGQVGAALPRFGSNDSSAEGGAGDPSHGGRQGRPHVSRFCDTAVCLTCPLLTASFAWVGCVGRRSRGVVPFLETVAQAREVRGTRNRSAPTSNIFNPCVYVYGVG